MKKTVFCSLLPALLALLFTSNIYALDAGIKHIVYATPEKPYLEINIEIAAASVTFKRVDSTHLQAGVDILILVKKGEAVAAFEKYRLSSPLVGAPRSLLDVKRMMIPPGEYELEISLQDIHDPENSKIYKAPLQATLPEGVYLTELLLLRSYRPDPSESPFVKNGYFLEPLPFDYYDRSATMLAFYAEIYHAGKTVGGDTYLLRYFLEEELGNGSSKMITMGNQRKKTSAIDAALVPMDISKLKSGNYTLSVELRNDLNELLCTRKVRFQRSNPFLDLSEIALTDDLLAKQFVNNLSEENLRYSLRAISPLLLGDEPELLKNVLQGSDLKAMRHYLFRHYVRKDPNNPEQAYKKYMELAGAVDVQFNSGFRRGFETDRGRAFLRYGRPDDLVHIEDDPSAPPYEIWVYYNFPFTNQKNVKFLFYNPSLAGEDFVLLHSTARGEINNPRWEVDLYKRNAGQQINGANYHDATSMQGNVGRNARMYFESF